MDATTTDAARTATISTLDYLTSKAKYSIWSYFWWLFTAKRWSSAFFVIFSTCRTNVKLIRELTASKLLSMQLLQTTDKDFSSKFKALVCDRREATVDVTGTVREILADVKVRGDAAVKDYTSRFDRYNPQSLHLSETFIAEHAAQCPTDVKAALELAAIRITAFHQKQLRKRFRVCLPSCLLSRLSPTSLEQK